MQDLELLNDDERDVLRFGITSSNRMPSGDGVIAANEDSMRSVAMLAQFNLVEIIRKARMNDGRVYGLTFRLTGKGVEYGRFLTGENPLPDGYEPIA